MTALLGKSRSAVPRLTAKTSARCPVRHELRTERVPTQGPTPGIAGILDGYVNPMVCRSGGIRGRCGENVSYSYLARVAVKKPMDCAMGATHWVIGVLPCLAVLTQLRRSASTILLTTLRLVAVLYENHMRWWNRWGHGDLRNAIASEKEPCS